MRFITSMICLVLFIAVFMHGLFMVSGIAPRTTARINHSLLGLVTTATQTLAQTRTSHSQEIVQEEATQPEETVEPERPTIIAQGLYDERPEGGTYHGLVQYDDESDEAPIQHSLLSPEQTPLRIRIPAIDIDATVVVPEEVHINALDTALMEGVVYYPDSGRVGKPGNAFFFGHSSWLPVVRNENFAIFNNLGDAEPGDRVIVSTSRSDFVYVVTGKRVANREEIWVSFEESGDSIITLSTCNSFGAKIERIVVEAKLVSW